MVQSQELRHYIHLFLRWWWLIALCALLGAGAAFAYSARQTPVYTATATLRVQFSGTGEEFRSVTYGEQLAGSHRQMLTGRDVLQAAIDDLGLDIEPDDLLGLIAVDQVPDAALVRVRVTYLDPAWAARIANALAEAYVAHDETVQQGRYADYLAGVQRQLDEIAAQIQETEAAIAAHNAPALEQDRAEKARLETVLAGYRNTQATLWNNYEQMRLTAALSTDSVFLFERALPPREADGPGALRNALLAGAVGAMIAAGIAFLIEYLDDTLKTPEDVQETLGLNTLGVIGRSRRENPDRIVAEHPRSPVAEAYRRLRTNVRFSSLDAPLRTLLVTSPGAAEGKSVVAANLATALAQAGLRAAIVDADLRRPRQHAMFGVAASEGLTRSLLDGRLNGSLVSVQDTQGLVVLPSGELPPNPAELLGSARMQAMLERVLERVEIAVIDSPPLLPVTDAAVLARSVDGVLLVIEAGRTRKSAARQALESLRQVGANVLGVVLNGVPQRRSGYAYYYQYPHEDQAANRPAPRATGRRSSGSNGRRPQVRPAPAGPRRTQELRAVAPEPRAAPASRAERRTPADPAAHTPRTLAEQHAARRDERELADPSSLWQRQDYSKVQPAESRPSAGQREGVQ